MADKFLRAEIIAVGSELLDLGRVESNSIFLSQRLKSVGARVKRKWVVGDSPQEIETALKTALAASSDVIIFSGGLGPTTDDITRESVAQALGRPLQLDPAIIDDLKRRAAAFGLKLTDNNRRQAMVPKQAEVLDNPNGSAPGLYLQQDGALIFLLPGPPRELKPMTEDQVLDRIRRLKPAPQAVSRCLRLVGLAESQVDHQVEGIYKSYPEVETTILSSLGIIDLHFLWTGPDEPSRARQALDELVARVGEKLGSRVYSERDRELEEVVGEILRERGKMLATAESCTGGWISKRLTDVAGSSDYYLGGVVAYTNQLKVDLLGVNETTLERFGAVSPQTAEQMARGVRERTGADIGLAVTGIAGPGGGSAEKPVGLVHLGLSMNDDTQSRRLQVPGERRFVRLRTVRAALDWVRRSLL